MHVHVPVRMISDAAEPELQRLHAGVVNGVQGSAQMLFQSLSYVAGLFVWQPQVPARQCSPSIACRHWGLEHMRHCVVSCW